jgi:hypothetical protein
VRRIAQVHYVTLDPGGTTTVTLPTVSVDNVTRAAASPVDCHVIHDAGRDRRYGHIEQR